MADDPKPEAGNPATDSKSDATSGTQSAQPPATAGGIPAATPTMASVRVEGIAELVTDVRHELHLIGRASKFEWVNRRLILLRNAIIAASVVIGAIVVMVMCYREAYRETLSITSFDVPAKLAERGITGQAVARGLFDELIRRRKTVTTLNAGDLKESWTENRSDVAIPDAGFTLGSLFKYLRSLTGKELVVYGEMLLDGDTVTLKARVQGYPARSVKGKLTEWESLLGELANYVFEVTQPVVLVSYLAGTATTPDDFTAISWLIRRLDLAGDATPPSTLAVAYYAYGTALQRQEQRVEALAAYDRAMLLDPKLGLAYLAAADLNYTVNSVLSDKLFKHADGLQINDIQRNTALLRRVHGATNGYDCRRMNDAYRKIIVLPDSVQRRFESATAFMLTRCEYQQAKGRGIQRNRVILHPDDAGAWNMLGLMYEDWPSTKSLADAINAYAKGAALDTDRRHIFVHFNFARVLAAAGEHERAEAEYKIGMSAIKTDSAYSRMSRAQMDYFSGEFRHAETILKQNIADAEINFAIDFYFIGLALDAQGKTDEALKYLRMGKVRFPLYCPLYLASANVEFKNGREKEGFAEFDDANRAEPRCDQPYLAYAKALIERKRIPEAKQKLETLLKVSPGSDGAAEAKDMLAKLANAG